MVQALESPPNLQIGQGRLLAKLHLEEKKIPIEVSQQRLWFDDKTELLVSYEPEVSEDELEELLRAYAPLLTAGESAAR